MAQRKSPRDSCKGISTRARTQRARGAARRRRTPSLHRTRKSASLATKAMRSHRAVRFSGARRVPDGPARVVQDPRTRRRLAEAARAARERQGETRETHLSHKLSTPAQVVFGGCRQTPSRVLQQRRCAALRDGKDQAWHIRAHMKGDSPRPLTVAGVFSTQRGEPSNGPSRAMHIMNVTAPPSR